MKPLYVLERYEYGWAIQAPPGETGVPMDALKECRSLFPDDAVLDTGIADFLGAIMVVGVPDGFNKWRKEIQEHLEASKHPKETKWILGLDTGTSSMTIFSALCDETYHGTLYRHFSDDRADTPHDADDFGRCYRLLKLFPEWESRLPEVGEKYPQTKWRTVAKNWEDLKSLYEAGNKEILYANLRACNL